MKTALDPRHLKRRKVVKSLFTYSFKKKKPSDQTIEKVFEKILKKKKEIDKVIAKSAPEWPIEQINRLDLAILRLAVYELIIETKEPPKVIIDEAVELAKRYGSEKSSSFVNGVLGTVFKNIKKKVPKKPKKPKKPKEGREKETKKTKETKNQEKPKKFKL